VYPKIQSNFFILKQPMLKLKCDFFFFFFFVDCAMLDSLKLSN
jgi:hypothetical protein